MWQVYEKTEKADGLIGFPGGTIENVEKFGLEIANKSIDDVRLRFSTAGGVTWKVGNN